jgi:hypothetical protein
MPDHHENELPGELKVAQRLPGKHLKLKLLGLATLAVMTAMVAVTTATAASPSTPLPAGATAFGIVVTSSSDAEKED